VLGSGSGLLSGAVSEAAREVLPKASTLATNAQGILDEVAENAAIRSTKANQQLINTMGDERVTAAAQAMRKEGLLGAKPADILEKAEKRIGEVGAEKGAIRDLAEQGGARASHVEVLKRIDEFESGLNGLQRRAIDGDLKALRESILEDANAGGNFRSLDDLRQSLAKKAKFNGGIGVDNETLSLKRQLSGVVRDEIDKQLVPQLGSDIGKHYADTKGLYGALKDVATLAKKGASYSRPSGVFGLGLYDLLAGIGGGAIHPLGIAAALGSKFMREYGPGVVAQLADKVAKSPTLAAVAESFAKKLPTLNMGAYGSLMADKAAQSSAHALAEHMVRSQVDPQYASTAQLAGLEPEAPEQHSAAIERATGTATTAGALQAHDESLDKHLAAVFTGNRSPSEGSPAHGSQEFGAKGMRRTSVESHRQMVKEAAELASNPDALVERVANNAAALGDVAPSIVAALTEKARVAAEYLAREGASPPPKGPLAMPHVPSHAEMHAYAMKVEVVREPMSVLRYAADGMLTRAQVDALKTVYPMLAHDIADRALSKLTEGPKNVPYKARLMLSLLTGIDVDGTMSPAAIAANQKAIASAGVREQAQRNQPTKSQGEALKVAELTATPGQKRDMLRSEDAV
jgi:hypothetical protein